MPLSEDNFFLILKKWAMKRKKLRNTDLFKQQQKTEAKYFSVINAGNEEINVEDSPHLM